MRLCEREDVKTRTNHKRVLDADAPDNLAGRPDNLVVGVAKRQEACGPSRLPLGTRPYRRSELATGKATPLRDAFLRPPPSKSHEPGDPMGVPVGSPP
jgi:hypothetical protein